MPTSAATQWPRTHGRSPTAFYSAAPWSSSTTPATKSNFAPRHSRLGKPKANDSVPQHPHHFADSVSALSQTALLIYRHWNRQRRFDPIAAHNARNTKANILHSHEAANQAANGHHPMLVEEYRFQNVAHRQPDCVIRRSLALDNLVRCTLHAVHNLVFVRVREPSMPLHRPIA